MADPLKLSAAIVERVRAKIAEHAGLEPPVWVVEARLAERIRALDLERPDAYAELVTSDRGRRELALLIEALRVGETRFFRHTAHVAALTRAVIPALKSIERKRGTIRAWSAGCATGEEAYTLAIVLARHLGGPHHVEVLATDISDDALAVARERVYPEAALRDVPAVVKQWAFEPGPRERTWRVTDQVAAAVRFERHNLADASFPRGFDIVWCRNVLIYFTPDARETAVERLIGSLAEGGFLFVGYAESLRDFAALEAVRTPDAVLYRKLARGRPQASGLRPQGSEQPASRSGPTPRAFPPPRPDASPQVIAEEALVELRGRYDGTERLSRELSAAIAGPYRRVRVDLDGADYLGDEAAAVLRRARSAARAAGVDLRLVAERAGTRRWLARWRLEDEP